MILLLYTWPHLNLSCCAQHIALFFVQLPGSMFESRNTGVKVVRSNENSKLDSKVMCLTTQWNSSS